MSTWIGEFVELLLEIYLLSEKINFFLHGDDHTLAWALRGIGGGGGEIVHFKK